MSTPPFSSTSSAFDEVRLYTEFDPYYYITDNRPLQDIAGNSNKMADAVDAGRTAAAIGTIMESAYNAAVHGFETKVVGLSLTNPSVGVVSVYPGVLLSKIAINSSDSREILKKAALPYTTNLNTPHPVTLGKEVQHLIQIRHRDFDGTTVFPYYQAGNGFSASSMVPGWLEVAVVTGNEADIGSSVAPTATVGWSPLWLAKAVAGDLTVTVSTPVGALGRINNVVEEAPLSNAPFYRINGIWSQLTTAPRGNSSVSFATTEFVNVAGDRFRDAYSVTSNTALTGSQVNGFVRATTSGSITVTLPDSTLYTPGDKISIAATGTGTVVLAAFSGETLDNLAGNAVTPTLRQGNTAVFVRGADGWQIVGGSLALTYSDSFLSSNTANGYQKLPSGLVLQWATSASISAGGTGSVTLPLVFPTAALFAISNTTASAGSATNSNIVAGTPTTTTVPLYNLGTVAGVAKVFAIGH